MWKVSNGHVIFYGLPSCMNLFLHTMVDLLQLYIFIFFLHSYFSLLL